MFSNLDRFNFNQIFRCKFYRIFKKAMFLKNVRFIKQQKIKKKLDIYDVRGPTDRPRKERYAVTSIAGKER